MATLILPGGKERHLPVRADKPVRVREVREMVQLTPKQSYRLLVRSVSGELTKLGDDDILEPEQTLQAVPRSIAG